MVKEFLTKNDVSIVKGYLSKDSKKVVPVCNNEFIHAQNHAEYVITFAKLAKGKDFIGKQPDSIIDLRKDVLKALDNKDTEYIKAPEKIEGKIHNQLHEEALNFIKYDEKLNATEKVNKFLQNFNVINEFEETGLFFDTTEICKLNKIYTIKEIVEATNEVIDLLD